MYVSLSGVCSIHSGYCTGDSIRVDIQIADPHGNLLGGQQPCTQIKLKIECTGDSIRVDIQTPDPHGHLL